MTNTPIFSDQQKQLIARYLDGNLVHPSTPFEARAWIEQAISRMNQAEPAGEFLAAAYRQWADEVDPHGGPASASTLN